ncbi:MAG: hypothetical protein ABI574_10690 [Burkholderiales bacterium]
MAEPSPARNGVGRRLRWLITPLLWVVQWLLALLILFEEWGWEPLARLFGQLARLPGVRRLEAAIGRLPPYAALAVFFLPSLALVPVKLLALWFIGRGHALLGLAVIIAAKVLGTAVVARLFMLTQAQLMQLAWFARLYARWSSFKTGLLAQVRASPAWRGASAMKARVKAWWSRLGSDDAG